MKVWVIRHGESETNKDGLWTGWLDASLTEKGKSEAEQVGRLLSNVNFDKIYASDLSRAKTTAEIALPACEYEVVVGLREINVGSIAGRPLKSVKDSDKEQLSKDGYRIFGGESREEFGNRVRSFMKLLEGQNRENVAVFTHAGVLRTALDNVLDTEVPRKNVRCQNCAVAIFEYKDLNWSLHSWINLP
jgi:broad specificity phosphatase PhoE